MSSEFWVRQFLTLRQLRKALVLSSATFMAQSIGIALIMGPNQRMCLVVRQNVPAP